MTITIAIKIDTNGKDCHDCEYNYVKTIQEYVNSNESSCRLFNVDIHDRSSTNYYTTVLVRGYSMPRPKKATAIIPTVYTCSTCNTTYSTPICPTCEARQAKITLQYNQGPYCVIHASTPEELTLQLNEQASKGFQPIMCTANRSFPYIIMRITE